MDHIRDQGTSMSHQGIQTIDRTTSKVTLDPKGMTFKRDGTDTVTHAWTSKCPYTGKETNHNRTYTFDGIGNWV